MTKCKCRCFSWSWFRIQPVLTLESAAEVIETGGLPTNVKVNSEVQKEQVHFVENTPEQVSRHKFPFNCPICMRFFSHILACESCKNYICHRCADDLEAYEKVSSRCPHCNVEPLVLEDEKMTEAVRTYFDSPVPRQLDQLEAQLNEESRVLMNQGDKDQ